MSVTSSWYVAYAQELSRAQRARKEGNEGMARVCARRAVGLIIGEYLQRLGHPQPALNAYQRVKFLESIPSLSPQVKQVAGHFLLFVDEDHNLPPQVDLLSEAHWLAQQLLDVE